MITKVKLKSNNMTTIPLVAMRGTVMFPNTVNHFDVGRKKSVAAIEYAMKTRTPIFLISQRDATTEEPTKDDLFRYGVVAEIQQVLRLADNFVKVLVECRYRARLLEFHDEEEDYYTVSVMRSNAKQLKDVEVDGADAIVRAIREQLDEYTEYFPKLSSDIVLEALSEQNPSKFVEFLAHNLSLDFNVKQDILEESNVMKRLIRLYNALIKENNILNIERDITNKVQESIDQNQREYYLREQIKVISDELGEGEDTVTEAEEYRKKIKELPLEAAYLKKLLKEVERLVQTPSNSQEAAVIRTYLDTVVDLPWNVFTQDNYNLRNAQRVLDRDHYGLKKVKERIIEFLAVRSLTENQNSQIICLVGPPGVGKTSIARSIAECMKKKFVRMSLGGVRDESEIRGHRRTYVGSMPGRIINAIDHAGSSNPLILLDEIDKLGNDYRGDPASALLEVLDPEQNNSFRDHFLDLPYDLSRVLFITTANDASAIPAPLYDRMDVIELSSYTREEKLKIAKLHLIKKQLLRHGLTKEQFSITDKALYELIDDYTREAGVRNLERKLASLIRKSARAIVSGKNEAVKADCLTLEKLLGPPMNRGSIASHKAEVGIVNGLAWTSVGGEVMPIETTVVEGTGKLEITGSLGDVMKESAKLAITYIRTLSDKFSVPKDLLSKYDIHIHAPEGAVPKDGPSAGVTLCVSLLSAVCNIPVKKNLAMTGEITLKGRVIPIGGLKEKLIAAYKEKLDTVLIPRENACDLAEIEKEIVDGLHIVLVDRIEDVLEYSLMQGNDNKSKTGNKAQKLTKKINAKREIAVSAAN